jgi:hypothetical protein
MKRQVEYSCDMHPDLSECQIRWWFASMTPESVDFVFTTAAVRSSQCVALPVVWTDLLGAFRARNVGRQR